MEKDLKHKLLFVGDVVMNSTPIFSDDIIRLFSESIVRSCNLEAPFPVAGKAINKTGPIVDQGVEAKEHLFTLNFNLFSMANNHIYDYGDFGLFSTMSAFPSNQIIGVGNEEDAYSMCIKTIDNINYGFVAYGENGYGAISHQNKNGYAWVNHPRVNRDLKRYKSQVDILIVQVHAGVEMVDIPIPEWRSRYKEILDMGADVVIAHHPHVLQGIETYNDKFIFYSLGNFYFDYTSRDARWNTGAILQLDVINGKINNYNIAVTRRKGCNVELEKGAYSKELVNSLSEKILSPDYEKNINEIAVNQWKLHHASYYAKPFNGIENYSLKKLAKHFKRLIFQKRIDYSMLWHNLFIESNLWIVKRAIDYLSKQGVKSTEVKGSEK